MGWLFTHDQTKKELIKHLTHESGIKTIEGGMDADAPSGRSA